MRDSCALKWHYNPSGITSTKLLMIHSVCTCMHRLFDQIFAKHDEKLIFQQVRPLMRRNNFLPFLIFVKTSRHFRVFARFTTRRCVLLEFFGKSYIAVKIIALVSEMPSTWNDDWTFGMLKAGRMRFRMQWRISSVDLAGRQWMSTRNGEWNFDAHEAFYHVVHV